MVLLLVGLFVGTLHVSAPAIYAGDSGVDGAVANGDVNCDGRADVADIIFMLDWLFRGGDRPCPVAESDEQLLQREAELVAELAGARAALSGTQQRLAVAQSTLQLAQQSLLECTAELTGLGCTDPDATNYQPCATVNDNSCEYSP